VPCANDERANPGSGVSSLPAHASRNSRKANLLAQVFFVFARTVQILSFLFFQGEFPDDVGFL
jgi:hypothetical protein